MRDQRRKDEGDVSKSTSSSVDHITSHHKQICVLRISKVSLPSVIDDG